MKRKFNSLFIVFMLLIAKADAVVIKVNNPYMLQNFLEDKKQLEEESNLIKKKQVRNLFQLKDEDHKMLLTACATFIGILIAVLVKQLISSHRTPIADESYYKYTYNSSGSLFERRLKQKKEGKRFLKEINQKIHKGENKVATYINRVLFNKHNILLSKPRLFHEVVKVRRYFDETGLALPNKLTERKLYQLTKNVVWNLHHLNIDSRPKLVKSAIHNLYKRRSNIFDMFIKVIGNV